MMMMMMMMMSPLVSNTRDTICNADLSQLYHQLVYFHTTPVHNVIHPTLYGLQS